MADVNHECAVCKHQRKRCDAQCPYRGCFGENEFDLVSSAFSPDTVIQKLGAIEDKQRRIIASKHMRLNALLWVLRPMEGPGAEISRLEHEIEVARNRNRSLHSTNESFRQREDQLQQQILQLHREVSGQVINNQVAAMPNMQRQEYQQRLRTLEQLQDDDVNVAHNAIEQKFTELFNYVQNMTKQVLHPQAFEQPPYQSQPVPHHQPGTMLYQSHPTPYLPQTAPYPPYQPHIAPYPPYPPTAIAPYPPYQPQNAPNPPNEPHIAP